RSRSAVGRKAESIAIPRGKFVAKLLDVWTGRMMRLTKRREHQRLVVGSNLGPGPEGTIGWNSGRAAADRQRALRGHGHASGLLKSCSLRFRKIDNRTDQ